MHREIKFRAWKKEEKWMIYPTFVLVDKRNEELDNPMYYGDVSPRNSDGQTDLDELELMQYTGLKDKNGKEIYESDIVKDLDGKLCIVEFQLGCFVLKTDKWPHIFHGYNTRLCEVVGNIYENPDLTNPKGQTV